MLPIHAVFLAPSLELKFSLFPHSNLLPLARLKSQPLLRFVKASARFGLSQKTQKFSKRLSPARVPKFHFPVLASTQQQKAGKKVLVSNNPSYLIPSSFLGMDHCSIFILLKPTLILGSQQIRKNSKGAVARAGSIATQCTQPMLYGHSVFLAPSLERSSFIVSPLNLVVSGSLGKSTIVAFC